MSRKSRIVKEAIRRFFYLGNKTIARHLIETYPELFLNKNGKVDIEVARMACRYYTGKLGIENLKVLKDKSLVRDTPTKLPQTWSKERPPYKLDIGLWLILSDIHIPFHENKPLEAAIQNGQAENVDGIFLNGDAWEAQALSFWPQTKRDFNKELEAFIDFLDVLQESFPDKPIVYKPGNHEYRLPSYFISHAPELVGTPVDAMERVLGFEERNIEFLDFYQLVYAGKLPILHGHEVKNIQSVVNPARGLFQKTLTFAACGHCHRTSSHSEVNLKGDDLTCHSFGCLCNLSPDWWPYCNKWNWGFGLVNVEKNGDFEVINRRILPSGQVV
jgi:predicted phosphodiesterase